MAHVARRVDTYEDYLALDDASALRHEWLGGVIVAMTGGTPEHAQLIAEVMFQLRDALQSLPCAVYGGDLRLRIQAHDATVYPDVQVLCGPRHLASDDARAVTNPVLIVEVLSETTEAFDRGRKFELYEGVATLRHYVLVSQGRRRVEHFARRDDGTWTRTVAGPGDRLRLGDLATLDVDALYAPVEAARAAEVRG